MNFLKKKFNLRLPCLKKTRQQKQKIKIEGTTLRNSKSSFNQRSTKKLSVDIQRGIKKERIDGISI